VWYGPVDAGQDAGEQDPQNNPDDWALLEAFLLGGVRQFFHFFPGGEYPGAGRPNQRLKVRAGRPRGLTYFSSGLSWPAFWKTKKKKKKKKSCLLAYLGKNQKVSAGGASRSIAVCYLFLFFFLLSLRHTGEGPGPATTLPTHWTERSWGPPQAHTSMTARGERFPHAREIYKSWVWRGVEQVKRG